MWKRKDYMDKNCTHREYYGQFVTSAIMDMVKTFIGEKDILQSKDEHFNDIPLHKWDNLANTFKPCVTAGADEYGDGKVYYSLGNAVCILKEAARQIVEGHNPE